MKCSSFATLFAARKCPMKIVRITSGAIALVMALLPLQALPAETVAERSTTRVCFRNLSGGWYVDIFTDGSARIVYGASDQMRTAPDLFDMEQIEAELRLLPDGLSSSGITGSIHKEGVHSVTSRPVEDPDHVRSIVRKAFENAGNVEKGLGPRFRQLIRDHPPFGITDLEPSDDQLEARIPMSLTLYRQLFRSEEITGDEPAEYYTVGRKSRAYYEAIRKKRTERRPTALLESGDERLLKRSRAPRGDADGDSTVTTPSLVAGVLAAGIITAVVLMQSRRRGRRS